MGDTVISKSLFKVEVYVLGQIDRGYAADAKRKELMIQIIPNSSLCCLGKNNYISCSHLCRY